MLKKIYKKSTFQSFLLFSSSVFNKGLGLVFNMVAARMLGVELFGRYNFVWAFAATFTALSDFGLTNVVLCDIPLQKKRLGDFLGNVLSLKTILAIFYLILTFAFANILGYSPETKTLIYLCALLVFPNIASNFLLLLSSCFRKILYPVAVSTFLNIFITLVNILIILRTNSLLMVFANTLLLNIIFATVSFFLTFRTFIFFSFKNDPHLWQYLLKEGFAFFLLSIFANLYFRIDMVLLSKIKDEQAIGFYSAAYKFFDAWLLIPSSYNFVFLPFLSKLQSQNMAKFEKTWRKSVFLMMVIGGILALILNIFSATIINLFVGKNFGPSVLVLKILAPTLPFLFANAVLYNVYYIFKKQQWVSKIFLAAILINLGLNIYLIPKFSFIGAAWVTLITEIFVFILAIIFIKRLKNEKN